MIKVSDKYIAGFFDGEGSIGLYRGIDHRKRRMKEHKKVRYSFGLIVTIVNTHLKILEVIKQKFGGNIRKHLLTSKGKICWEWRKHGKSAIPFLKALQPYVVVKKEQVVLGLEYERKYKDDGPNKPNQTEKKRKGVVADKNRYVKQMKQLKKVMYV